MRAKIKNLMLFLTKSNLNKYANILHKISSNYSDNILDIYGSRYVYVLNYKNENTSLYYVGKTNDLHRRIVEHKVGFGAHVVHLISRPNWEKRITEIIPITPGLYNVLTEEVFDQDKVSDDENVYVEEMSAKCMMLYASKNLSMVSGKSFLSNTLSSMDSDIKDGKKVLVLGGGIGESSYNENLEYIGDDFESEKDSIQEFFNKSSEGNLYFKTGARIENLDGPEDLDKVEGLKNIFSSNNLNFEELIKDLSVGSEKDKSVLKKNINFPNGKKRRASFKIFSFSNPTNAQNKDNVDDLINSIENNLYLGEAGKSFLEYQIKNVLFNFMLYLKNYLNAMIIMDLSSSFGEINLDEASFYVSPDEMHSFIDGKIDILINEVYKALKETYPNAKKYYNLSKDKDSRNYSKFFRSINYICLNIYEEEIFKMFEKKVAASNINNYFNKKFKEVILDKKLRGSGDLSKLTESINNFSKLVIYKRNASKVKFKDESRFYFYEENFSKQFRVLLNLIKELQAEMVSNPNIYVENIKIYEILSESINAASYSFLKGKFKFIKNSIRDILNSNKIYNIESNSIGYKAGGV
tara:strand:- start:2365 stop:4104 length:1740 start_codon:yes stop_codon:yes gene_type:complete